MRIITGTARGTKLDTLEGIETRPTAERVKEALFSMIQFDIEGRRVLDLFAGSGQLGLEALSRGAASATFVDVNNAASDIVKANAKKAKLFDKSRVLTTDWKSFIKENSGKEIFDIIFLDPPYASTFAYDAAEKLVKAGMISGGGIVIIENNLIDAAEIDGLSLVKHSRYGKTYISVYTKSEAAEEE